MPVHPDARQLLGELDAAGVLPFELMDVEEVREAARGFIGLQDDPPAGVAVEERLAPGPGGRIPVRVYSPDGEGPLPVIVWFHGGGWVAGDLDVVDAPLRALAARAAAIVISVGYRLAPEHPYPAAFDDGYAATIWATREVERLGGDPARLAVGGDGAGATLAAAVAVACRDRYGPVIAAQLLVHPLAGHGPTVADGPDGHLLRAATLEWLWGHYLRGQDPAAATYADPLRVDDLTGLPPAFVATSEFDVVRDEGEGYAARLRAAGVDVTARRYEGLPHGFFWYMGAVPCGATVVDDLAAALRAAPPTGGPGLRQPPRR